MAQWEKFSKVEKKYYNKMMNILTKYFQNKGYKDIKQINTVGKRIDCENGVDCQFILDGKTINIAFRCRENCNYRDITIRNTASFDEKPSELAKIKDKKYLADLYLYCWFNTRLNHVEFCIVNMKKLTYEKIDANKKELQYNRNEDYELDGSTFYPVGIYDIKECISYHNVKQNDFYSSRKRN